MKESQEVFSPAFLQTLGPRIDSLPFATPAEAEASLSLRSRRQLATFRRKLAGCGLDDDPALGAVRAMGELFPGCRVILHPGAHSAAPPWMLHNVPGHPSLQQLTDSPIMHRARCYHLRGADTFADRPVSLSSLLATRTSSATRAETMLKVIWANGMYHQLRMVIYRFSSVFLYAGVYRRRGEEPFDIEDHALLLAARHDLTQWADAFRLVGSRPLGEGTLGDLTEVMTEPLVLIVRDRIVHASPRARSLFAAQGPDADLAGILRAHPKAVVRVHGEPVRLVLMIPRAAAQKPAPPLEIEALPPSLQLVAVHLARGLSDKEIAQRTGRPLATIRTYVARTFERLGVHDRRELIRRHGAAAGSSWP